MCRAVKASHLRKTHTVEERAVTTWMSEKGFFKKLVKTTRRCYFLELTSAYK